MATARILEDVQILYIKFCFIIQYSFTVSRVQTPELFIYRFIFIFSFIDMFSIILVV